MNNQGSTAFGNILNHAFICLAISEDLKENSINSGSDTDIGES